VSGSGPAADQAVDQDADPVTDPADRHPLALVSGASTGLGRHLAESLADDGWHVLAGVRSAAAGDELRSAGHSLLEPVGLDVTDEAAVEAAAARVDAVGGRLDAVVANAGIGIGGPMELVSPDDLRRVLEVNVVGAHAVVRAVLPALRRARGRVILMSSVSGRVAMPCVGPYAASKFALEAIGDALRREVRHLGVRVTLVEPGPIDTPIWHKAIEEIEARAAGLSEDLEAAWGSMLAVARHHTEAAAAAAVPPDAVTRVIRRVLAARRPPARVVVGSSLGLGLFRALPTPIADRLIARGLRRSGLRPARDRPANAAD